MANNRIGGVVYIKADGKHLEARGKWKAKIPPTKREGIAGQDGTHGYKEMPIVQRFEGEVSYVRGNIRISDLHALENATVVMEVANGNTLVLRNAWVADEIDLDTEEGSFPLVFEGLSASELS